MSPLGVPDVRSALAKPRKLASGFWRGAWLWLTRMLVAVAGIAAFIVPAHATVAYTVSLDHPEQHLFHVTISAPAEAHELQLALPAWNALYQIRDFAGRVRDVSAMCSTGSADRLDLEKVDKQDWRVSLGDGCRPNAQTSVVIRYDILWNEPGPFDSQLDTHHAFLNLGEILMYIPERRYENTTVQFTGVPAGWQSSAALVIGPEHDTFEAANYDVLVDSPVEIGKSASLQFESAGASIAAVVDAKLSAAAARDLQNGLLQITTFEMRMMRDNPFDRRPGEPDYIFLFHIGPTGEVGGGGMEHRNSCAISAGSVEEAVAIAAHEFFHAWNVKRIRPQSLEPVDYSREQYTRVLWFAEGVTNTYEDYALVRTGIWSYEQYYRNLAGQISALQLRPARKWQSAEESSLDAWFEGFADYNDPARSISYYNKGEILGVMLDLAIRDVTDNRKSLDDVMRLMNDDYARAGKYYKESSGIESAVEEVSGKSFQDFFAKYVSGTAEIPYNVYLGIAGLQLAPSPERNAPPYVLTEISHPSERQTRIRESILQGTGK